MFTQLKNRGMKNFKVVISWVVIINAIIVFNQSLFSRDLSEIINKTTLNYNVNDNINEIKQWKARELALFNQNGEEQNQLQAQFLEFFIQRKRFKNPSESEFKSMLTNLFDIQRRSKDKYEALYLASTFHIAEMSLPYAPKFSHKLFETILKKNDSNIGSRLNYEVNFILGTESQLDGNYLKAMSYYKKCYNKVKPEDAYLNAKILISIALCELSQGKLNTAKSHIDLSMNLLKEKGNLSTTEKSSLKFMESVNYLYQVRTRNAKISKEKLEQNYDTKFNNFICIYRYEIVSAILLDLYIAEGNKIGYSRIFNDINRIVSSNIHTKYKIDLLKIKHDKYEKLGMVDKSKIEFNRLNKIYLEQEKLTAAISENIIELLIENEQKVEILNDEITQQNEVYFDLSILFVLVLIVGLSFTIGYKKYYAKDIAARRAIVRINEFERKQEASKLILEKHKEEITNLNLVLGMKTESEKALIEKIKEYKKDNSLNAEQMLVDFQMQLNNLVQIDLKNTGSTKSTKGENDVFFDKIKSLHPELSSHDLNLCSYIRLKLNSKEISLITGITPGSVRVYKTKLKNKLGLKNEENLNQYLQTI